MSCFISLAGGINDTCLRAINGTFDDQAASRVGTQLPSNIHSSLKDWRQIFLYHLFAKMGAKVRTKLFKTCSAIETQK